MVYVRVSVPFENEVRDACMTLLCSFSHRGERDSSGRQPGLPINI